MPVATPLFLVHHFLDKRTTTHLTYVTLSLNSPSAWLCQLKLEACTTFYLQVSWSQVIYEVQYHSKRFQVAEVTFKSAQNDWEQRRSIEHVWLPISHSPLTVFLGWDKMHGGVGMQDQVLEGPADQPCTTLYVCTNPLFVSFPIKQNNGQKFKFSFHVCMAPQLRVTLL